MHQSMEWRYVKGRYAWDFIYHPDRLSKPKVRKYLLDGSAKPNLGDKTSPGSAWVETDWKTALDITADKLGKIISETGPDSVGILASAKCTNEENYLMNKFSGQG